ncbi:MAG: hypothetical protein IJE10_03900 [Clostridia bacterium]|nr:hypothetical protein [Clostridia bacterium]
MNKLDFLKNQHLCMFDQKRMLHKELVCNLYKEYISDKEIDKENKWSLYSNFYLYFAKSFPAEIYEKECIVGTNWHWRWQSNIPNTVTPRNAGHFIADFQDFLKKGIKGKLKEVCTSTDKRSIKTTLNAFAEYIKSYAKIARQSAESSQCDDKERLLTIASDCEYISENPPVSFRQALQFVWFIQCFLETEAGSAAISFGRMDSYLHSYYKRDIENSILTPEEAKELIMAFYIKVSEGDESTMLTVGGNIENELTALFIEAQTQIYMRQPSIALRVSKTTSTDIIDKATELVLKGGGMPAYFNDAVIIEGLKMLGVDDETATNYGIVGCYEATPQGVFSNTVATAFNLYDSFNKFLEEKSIYSSFKDFLDSFKNYFTDYYANTLLPKFKNTANYDMNRVSPFASCVLNREKYLFGINILGIGILIDSLYTIKKLVFDEDYTTIHYLIEQAEKNFEDDSLYNRIVGLENHYGSNSDESNLLTKDISEFIGNVIQKHPLGDNIVSLPALFWFTADIWQRDYCGTINGRKKGELLSYGIMPCATPHTDTLTEVLLSCANVAVQYFPNGCPVMISLNKKEVEKENILATLIKTFFKAGGYHIAINTVNSHLLKKAKENPSEHKELLVKISGYSTQFTRLDETIQDAVIERVN